MTRVRSIVVMVCSGILLAVGVYVGAAQQEACPELVTKALQAVSLACENLERNTVCYGNNRLEASFETGAPVTFDQPADRASVDYLQTLRTFGLDEELGFWGVALLNIQADLPDTLPGQSVKFILYGDVTLENVAGDDTGFAPMQAFYFTSNSIRPACGEVPPDSLIIQSPQGYQVNLSVNGLDVTIGSTIALRAIPNQQMSITTLYGEAITYFEDEERIIPQGFEADMPLGGEDGLTIEDLPDDLKLIDDEEWENLAEASEEIWEEEVEIVDTDEWDSLEDYCADPVNADFCADPEFVAYLEDCDTLGCFEEEELYADDCFDECELMEDEFDCEDDRCDVDGDSEAFEDFDEEEDFSDEFESEDSESEDEPFDEEDSGEGDEDE